MASRNDATVVVTVDKDGHILTTDARIATLLSCQVRCYIGKQEGMAVELGPLTCYEGVRPWRTPSPYTALSASPPCIYLC